MNAGTTDSPIPPCHVKEMERATEAIHHSSALGPDNRFSVFLH